MFLDLENLLCELLMYEFSLMRSVYQRIVNRKTRTYRVDNKVVRTKHSVHDEQKLQWLQEVF